MSDEDEAKSEECKPGLPGWLATFADLMSLLMAFFILLLSFSQMDVLKFKRLAGSMKEAFGVQNKVNVNAIPKGTSIIAKEFSPGRPTPTPIRAVMQNTTDADKQTLDVLCQVPIAKAVAAQCSVNKQTPKQAAAQQLMIQESKTLTAKTENNAVEIAATMAKEIRSNMIEVETKGQKIIIRVQEKGSFASGSAELQPGFIPILSKLVRVLKGIKGHISIEGYTDNVPIDTYEFPSNWDLSVARALAVAHGLMDNSNLGQSIFSITGWGDTHPLVPNDSSKNRARNRRVEIIVKEILGKNVKNKIKKTQTPSVSSKKKLNLDDGFESLNPSEVF